MKRFILLLVFSFFALVSKAQLTADFPDSNFHWNESHYTRGCDGTCPLHYVEGTIFDSTSILINNKVYRSVYFKGSNFTYFIHIFPPIIVDIFNYTKFIGYIHNDKLNKKVYFRDSLNNTNDLLLFDFSLNIGDVYPVTKQHSQLDDSAYVFRIDTLTDTYGIRRSVKYVSGFGGANLYGSGAIIEGIGTLTGLLSNTIYGDYGWAESNNLTCFSNDTLNYSLGNSLPSPFYFSTMGGSCIKHQYLSVGSQKNTIIKIFPNPATSTFTINIPDEEATFTLINTLGQSQEILGVREGDLWKFEANDLPNGVYVLKALGAGKMYFGRFLKN